MKKDTTCEIIAGGMCDKSVGYFIQPTAIVTRDPKSITMTTELFGPVVTLFVYQADKYEETVRLPSLMHHLILHRCN